MAASQRQLALEFDAVERAPLHLESFLLRELEVFNWGPFAGFHRAEFDREGTGIIGPTGSGKTTLVDALMTLLVAQPRYNLASTGGNESDRDLISYVRGVLGGDGSDGREEVARPGKTITGLCATYQRGDETLMLGGLLWIDGTSNSTQDLKRRWLFSQADDQSLEKWLSLLHGDGIRDLTRMGRETAGLHIFESKKAYLARTRKFFDVGENAFTLLNRAAGLKQLHSIDDIFRDLVLDDRSAFDRALEVAGEFDNLEGIHKELEIARGQQESLVPVRDTYQKLKKSQEQVRRLETLKRTVSIWYAMAGERLWTATLAGIAEESKEAETDLRQARQREADCENEVDALRERYQKLGGNVIAELERTIAVQEERVADRKRHAADYLRMAAALGLSEELSAAALQRNQAALGKQHERTQRERNEKQQDTLNSLSRQRDLETNAEEIAAAIRKVRQRPRSNIPPKQQDFRAELADQLGMGEGDLPFLAELVEVKPEDGVWRGAIERAIGAERLRILVPEDRLPAALKWVNRRDNRLHVRLQRAGNNDRPGKFHTDGYTRKLNFKSHSLQATAKMLLARRDLHCVASTDALRTTEFGLTIEGMMSGRDGRFEKQDQRPLHEGWMTGFDNRDQLEALEREGDAIRRTVEQHAAESEQLRHELTELDNRLATIEGIQKLDFSTIDLPGTESDLARSQDRLAALLDPDSDTSRAKAAYDKERESLATIRARIDESNKRIAVLNDRKGEAEDNRRKAERRIGKGLSDEETELAAEKLPIPSDLAAKQLLDAERDAMVDVDAKLHSQEDRLARQVNQLIRFMEAALRADTGALADTGSELDDIDDYLERLRVLNEEALPEKLGRFLEYLNRSSDQGVTQLLSGIEEEVDAIEQRIAELNRTLTRVDFRDGRYLLLQPQRIKHERIRSLEAAMRTLRNAALKDDQGESHYKALQEMVQILRDAGENRRQQGSRALLDPRYRLQFFVVEVDRKTGDRSPPRTGSQSGSGGEKELMASHILTASLSYALCPPESDAPLYGTVVLDEAFSKSSPSAATRIIEALQVFRLHPIFVTPNKEIGLLKLHTRKVICVQRPKKEASLACISWETLAHLAPD